MTVTLSICIPTYNRSQYLGECLNSVLISVAGHEHEIEVVISDNASTDDTGSVIRAFQNTRPWIRYHRNAENVGGERNFYLLATLAQGANIWIFGDDDKMEPSAVSRVLDNIRAGYVLTICNYSLWDKQFSARKSKNGLLGEKDQCFDDSNVLMKRFGLHLGYLSAVVIKKCLFLKLPAEEYESFVEYGFPFLYAVYAGVANGACRAGFIAAPLVCNRGGNSGKFNWNKYFITGSSLIFKELLRKGYSRRAVRAANHQVLRDFVIPRVVGVRILCNKEKRLDLFRVTYRAYRWDWLFWFGCIPLYLAPSALLRFAKKIVGLLRRGPPYFVGANSEIKK